MAQRANKKAAKKTARMIAKPKAAKKSAKPAAKKAAKPARRATRKAVSRKVDPLNRENYTSLTPLLTVKDVRSAVGFYRDAFGFTVRGIMDSPQGPLHAELRLRDTTLMLSPEAPDQHSLGANSIGGTPATLYILVENVDDVFNRAVAAGGSVMMPVMDMFWGDRAGMIKDPEGNKWMIATHKAEPTEAEMMEAMQKMSQQPEQAGELSASAASGSQS